MDMTGTQREEKKKRRGKENKKRRPREGESKWEVGRPDGVKGFFV